VHALPLPRQTFHARMCMRERFPPSPAVCGCRCSCCGSCVLLLLPKLLPDGTKPTPAQPRVQRRPPRGWTRMQSPRSFEGPPRPPIATGWRLPSNHQPAARCCGEHLLPCCYAAAPRSHSVLLLALLLALLLGCSYPCWGGKVLPLCMLQNAVGVASRLSHCCWLPLLLVLLLWRPGVLCCLGGLQREVKMSNVTT